MGSEVPLLTAGLGYDTWVTRHRRLVATLPGNCFARVCNERGTAEPIPAQSAARAEEIFSPSQGNPYFACLDAELPTPQTKPPH